MAQGDVLSAIERINAKYGKNSFQKFVKKELDTVSTGSLLFDQALGKFKGYPEGAVVEAYGWEGSGKTLMMYLAIAEAQRKFPDRPCAIIDAERQFKYQSDWAESLGVDVEQLFVKEVASAEEAFSLLEMLILGDVEMDKEGNVKKVITPGNFAIIGVDSVTQLAPLADIHKDLDESSAQGAQASAIGKGMKKMVSAMVTAQTKSIIFMINQLRQNPRAGYGANPEYRPGGNSLKFVDVLAFEVKKINKSDEVGKDGKIISHKAKVKITKSKIASKPLDWIEFKLNYDGTGIDNDMELFEVGKFNGLLVKLKGRNKYGVAKNPRKLEEDESGDSIELNDKFPIFEAEKSETTSRDFKQYLIDNPKLKQYILDFIEKGQIYIKENQSYDKDEVSETQGPPPMKKKKGKVVLIQDEDEETVES